MIVATAVKYGDLIVSLPRPNRHHHILNYAHTQYGLKLGQYQGFLTSDGQFLDREDAASHAISCGQVPNIEAMHIPGTLISEDLW